MQRSTLLCIAAMDLDLFLSHPITYLKFYLTNDNYNIEDIARALGNLIVIAWAIHIVGRGSFSSALGIRPRQISGLPGIFFAHFLHFVDTNGKYPNNSHIVGNTLTFAILGLFIALQGLNLFYIVTIGIALASGIGTWLVGRDAVHAGASGVIYGYIGFLFVYGLVSRHSLAMILGIIAFFAYGRIVVGILPLVSWISWEMHSFGFLGGIIMAYIVSYAKTAM